MGNASFSDFAKKGFVQGPDGNLTHISKLAGRTTAKIHKLPNLLERAIPENLKVKNATKVEANGIKFDSKLEKYMYDLLTGANINFEFQKHYELMPKFKYGKESIRAIGLTVDFWLPDYNLIIDTKGFQTQQGAIRWKLLKSLLQMGDVPTINLPSSKKACDLLLNKILYDKQLTK